MHVYENVYDAVKREVLEETGVHTQFRAGVVILVTEAFFPKKYTSEQTVI